jgi:hypothetical protein
MNVAALAPNVIEMRRTKCDFGFISQIGSLITVP